VSGAVDPPFAYAVAKDGAVRISRAGAVVTVVAGERARRLAARLRAADPGETQQLLARATGNYRRGNERGERGDGSSRSR
jgi:hypothetical protein